MARSLAFRTAIVAADGDADIVVVAGGVGVADDHDVVDLDDVADVVHLVGAADVDFAGVAALVC